MFSKFLNDVHNYLPVEIMLDNEHWVDQLAWPGPPNAHHGGDIILFWVQMQHIELKNHTRSEYSNGHKVFSFFLSFHLQQRCTALELWILRHGAPG